MLQKDLCYLHLYIHKAYKTFGLKSTKAANINGQKTEDLKLSEYIFFLFDADPNFLPKNLFTIHHKQKKNQEN